MCNFKSAIISQSGEIYQHPFLDSHNDIIDLFHLQDGENPHWTPIEFLPGLDVFNLDTYTFKFDAERPFWADDDWIEQAKTKLSNIIKMMIVDKDTKILVDGAYLIKPKIKISKIITSRILLAKEADLSNANLFRADLSRADLSRADLSGANLSGANLSRANLSGADLSGADLSGANLFRADLSNANLSGADLSGADLSNAFCDSNPPESWKIENNQLVKN
jgi:hypothetical protein